MDWVENYGIDLFSESYSIAKSINHEFNVLDMEIAEYFANNQLGSQKNSFAFDLIYFATCNYLLESTERYLILSAIDFEQIQDRIINIYKYRRELKNMVAENLYQIVDCIDEVLAVDLTPLLGNVFAQNQKQMIIDAVMTFFDSFDDIPMEIGNALTKISNRLNYNEFLISHFKMDRV